MPLTKGEILGIQHVNALDEEERAYQSLVSRIDQKMLHRDMDQQDHTLHNLGPVTALEQAQLVLDYEDAGWDVEVGRGSSDTELIVRLKIPVRITE